MTPSLTARDIFQSAYENRYTWDSNFPGYTADLELRQGDEVYSGKVRVNSDLSVEVSKIEDEKIQESIYNQLRDVITHRQRTSFPQAHGKNTFRLGEEDPTGAIEILLEGDAMGSKYKVRGREICQVSRVMGPIAFTINTQDNWQTEDGYISIEYNAVFRNAKTNQLKGKRYFRETYEKIGNYYLPSRQVIEGIDAGGEKMITEFNFTKIKLLEPAVVG